MDTQVRVVVPSEADVLAAQGVIAGAQFLLSRNGRYLGSWTEMGSGSAAFQEGTCPVCLVMALRVAAVRREWPGAGFLHAIDADLRADSESPYGWAYRAVLAASGHDFAETGLVSLNDDEPNDDVVAEWLDNAPGYIVAAGVVA